jgi:hypothetical protein
MMTASLSNAESTGKAWAQMTVDVARCRCWEVEACTGQGEQAVAVGAEGSLLQMSVQGGAERVAQCDKEHTEADTLHNATPSMNRDG